MSAIPIKPDAKAALLEAAKRVFAEKGYERATVKDLADHAGVNVSLVSYYFGGKDGLYKSCLFTFAEERVEAMERILTAPTSIDELRVRLRLFAEEMIEVHMRDPDICTIIHRDLAFMNPVVLELFKGVFFKLFTRLVHFLRAAEKAKVIRKFKNYEILASHIFGSMMHTLEAESKRAAMGMPSIHDSKFREEFLSTWIDMTVTGLSPKEKD